MPTGYSPGGPPGGGAAESRSGYAPGGAVVTFDGDAFITARGDHLGMTLEERRLTLENRLQQGVVLYAGLWLQLPDRAGTGGVEVSVSGYARVAVSRWLNKTEGASVRRTNASAIYWPYFGEAVTIAGWGLWTAATDGRLRFFDHLRTSGSGRDPTTRTVPAGDRFGVGTGQNGIGLAL
jgi:hypothetical protein